MKRQTALMLVVLVPMLAPLVPASTAEAQQQVQVDFTILPPPFVSPSFERGTTDLKVRLTSSSLYGTGIAFSGAGFDGAVRTAFTDRAAADFQIGLFGESGRSDGTRLGSGTVVFSGSNITMGEVLLGVNIELQPFKTHSVTALLAAGPVVTFLYGDVGSTFITSGPGGVSVAKDSGTAYSYLYGLQGGAQLGLRVGKFHFDITGMALRQEGRSELSWSAAGKATTPVPAAMVTSLGIDLVYLPWNVTAGAVVQTTGKKDTNEGYTTRLYQLSWKF